MPLPRMPPASAASRGFTLMEVLVVLVITSLVATVLLQALSQSYGLQQRFGVQLRGSEAGAMQVDWFRQVVQALQPDLPEGPGRLSGDSRSLRALVTDPFGIASGASQPIELTLRSETAGGLTQLSMRTADRETSLAGWPGLRDAAFVYIDAEGKPHDRWPPPLGTWPALPGVIELRLRGTDGDQTIVAVPRITAMPQRAGDAFQAFSR